MGQTLLRLFDDKKEARTYFERALKLKPTAIDTNYFLALMDIEDGQPDSAREKLLVAQKGNFSPLNYATPEKIKEALHETESSG